MTDKKSNTAANQVKSSQVTSTRQDMESETVELGKSKIQEPRQTIFRRLKRTEKDWDASAHPNGVLLTGSKIESDGGVITELATISPEKIKGMTVK
jgi:hypothetical protein